MRDSRAAPAALETALHAEPNVTPMLDVLLVLLVLFMLTVPLSQRVLPAHLPQEEAGPPDTALPLVLEVEPGAEYRLDRQVMGRAALAARLATYGGRATLLVEGAAGASYQDVITAMDLARGAGVRVIGLAPRRTPAGGPTPAP